MNMIRLTQTLFFCHICLGNSIQLTPLQLEALLTEGNTSRFWLVGIINHISCSQLTVLDIDNNKVFHAFRMLLHFNA